MATDKTYLVVPDIHVPYHDISFLALIKKVAKIVRPHGIIQLGDALDFWQISSYDKNPLRKQTIAEDAAIYSVILQEWADLLPVDGVIHQLEGNHEDRLRRYIWRNARELAGIVPSVPDMVGLRKLGIRTVWHDLANWRSCQIGDAFLHHGCFFSKHVAMANLDRYQCNFVCGHTHRFQHVTNGKYYSVTLGHGSNEYETAHIPAPMGWQEAFATLTVSKGKTIITPILVNNATCIVNGRRIEA